MVSQINPKAKEEHLLALESRYFKGAELNYITTEREILIPGYSSCFQEETTLVATSVIDDSYGPPQSNLLDGGSTTQPSTRSMGRNHDWIPCIVQASRRCNALRH